MGRGNARSITEGGACEGGLSVSRPCFLWGAVAVDPKYLSDSVKTQLFEVRGVWWIIGKMAPVDASHKVQKVSGGFTNAENAEALCVGLERYWQPEPFTGHHTMEL